MKIFIIVIFSFFHLITISSQHFTEVSNLVGIDYNYPGISYSQIGAGVIVLDVNNDGWDDIFQAGGVFKSKLWVNYKGKFVDETYKWGLSCLDSMFVQTAISGDVNNDGYSDLFICNFGEGVGSGDHKPPLFLLNNGTKFFPVYQDVFNEVGNYTSATFGDINEDGYLDLFVTNYIHFMNMIEDSNFTQIGYAPDCNPNKFYVNQDGNGFIEMSVLYNLNNDGCGLASCFSDYDNDGDVDLFMLNDFGEWNNNGNRLYRNEFPINKFTQVEVESGFYKEMYGMGVGPGDYDNDGDLDYYVTNIGENYLFNNQNNGTFINVAKQLILDNTFVDSSLRGTSWSGIFFDMDNDSDLDLYVAKGNVYAYIPKTVVKDPNKLFLNIGNGQFKDISKRSSIDDVLSHRGAAFLDFDHDGDLDIISSPLKLNWGDFENYTQKIHLYRNDQSTKNNWIALKLIGDENTNRDALGSHIEVITENTRMLREVDGGSGHGSQSSRINYFGLGKNKKVNQIKVYWLNGKVTVLDDLDINHAYILYESGNTIKLY